MILFNKIRNKVLSQLFVCMAVFVVVLVSCEKVNLATSNVVITLEISNIRHAEASGGGKIYNEGKTYINSRGICWGTEPMPTIKNNKTVDGSGDGSFSSFLTGLSPNTTYHVRAYATSGQETIYGNNVIFTTRNSTLPVLKTSPVSNLTPTSCVSGGTIIFEGEGNIISRGVCWSTNYPPGISDAKTIDGTGRGSFISSISGLDPDSTYCIRAYATNNEGTAYGNVFYIKPYKKTVTDLDGNVYNTVSIGTQIWTVENLKVTKYQNGDLIQNILENSIWNNLETGAYCDYNNDSISANIYGRFYNWYAASDHRNIAPKGWRVATYEDYQVLINYLGGPLKAEENMEKNGFSALPGGKRNRDGIFMDNGIYPYFWTSTEYHEGSTWARYVILDGGELDIICLSKNYGFSVRCVRD